MATRKQLAALKKARAARKRNLAAKKRKKIVPKSKPKKRKRKLPAKRTSIRSPKPKAKKRRVKRNPSAKEYFVFTKKGKTKYWLQKISGKWAFHSTKPNGMSEQLKNDAMRVAQRFLSRLPAGCHIYMDVQKKRA
jgi:hypothetical protein